MNPPLYLDDPDAIARRLRILMRHHDETSGTLAPRAGMMPRSIRRYLAGQCMAHLPKLSRVFRGLGYRVRLELEPVGE